MQRILIKNISVGWILCTYKSNRVSKNAMDGFDGVLSKDRLDRNDLEWIVEKTKYTKTVLRNS